MDTEILVRSAVTSDAETIVEFNIAMAWETEAKQLSRQTVSAGVRDLQDRPHAGFYLIAVVDGATAGCLMVTFEWSDWRDGFFWWIQSVYVKPEFRRRGVFKGLYNHLQELASQRTDVCGLRLYVERDNTIAQQTYRSLSMRETSYRMFEIELQ